MSKKSIAAILVMSLFLSTCPSWAEEEKRSSDDAFFQELPVVLTASRLSQPISETPSAMTVIDREMIRASGYRTIPDLMRLVPGMYVGFLDANNPVVSFHGSADQYAHRMQILIDGTSVYLPPLGTVNWAELPVLFEDIERIEVVRGPSSASFGANSFYGVINIITRDALSQQGASVSMTGGYASDVSARLGDANERFDYRFSAGYRSDAGYDNGVLNDHNATKLVNFRGNFYPDAVDHLEIQIGYGDGIYGSGIVGRMDSLFRDTTAKSGFQHLGWTHLWSAEDETRLGYSHITDNAVDPLVCVDIGTCDGHRLPATPIAQGFVESAVYSQRNELEIQNSHQLGSTHRLVWGGAVRRDFADFPLYLTLPHATDTWQLFVHDEWRAAYDTVLNIGSMYEDDGMGNRTHSPRASVNYHFTPRHTLRLGISTATRSPNMFESFVNANNQALGGVYVSPAIPLSPEKILSREVGYIGEFPGQGVIVDMRAYIDKVTDTIWWDKYVAITPTGFPDSYKNLFSTEYQGIDATIKYHWDENRSFLVANYAFQKASASLTGIPTQYFNPTPDPVDPVTYSSIGDRVRQFYQNLYLALFPQTVPTNSYSILLSKSVADSWQVSGGYYARWNMRVGDVGTDVTPEYKMQRLDLRVAKTFKLAARKKAEIAFVLQNATQENYPKYGPLLAVANVMYTRRGWLTGKFDF